MSDSSYFNIRKIRKSDLKKAEEVLAESFFDYPTMKCFFPDEKKRTRQLKLMMRFRLYTNFDFTYVNDDVTVVIAIARPGTKERSALGIYIRPTFTIPLLLFIGLGSVKKIYDFMALTGEIEKKYYDPEKHTTFKAFAIKKEKRNFHTLLECFQKFDDGSPMYVETSTESLEHLYKILGFHTVYRTTVWDIPHILMIRDAKTEEKTEQKAEEK